SPADFGMIRPAVNAPNRACTPICSVVQLDRRISRTTAERRPGDRRRPFQNAPSEAITQRTGPSMHATNKTNLNEVDARIAQFEAERTIAVKHANSNHALASSIAAHDMAILPKSVPSKSRSRKMRARTGKAVTLMAVPTNTAKWKKGTWAPASLG